MIIRPSNEYEKFASEMALEQEEAGVVGLCLNPYASPF